MFWQCLTGGIGMVIQQVAAAIGLGEQGRLSKSRGNGPAQFFSRGGDSVTLGVRPANGAGLYTGTPLFKMLGTVELVTPQDDTPAFGDKPILI